MTTIEIALIALVGVQFLHLVINVLGSYAVTRQTLRVADGQAEGLRMDTENFERDRQYDEEMERQARVFRGPDLGVAEVVDLPAPPDPESEAP